MQAKKKGSGVKEENVNYEVWIKAILENSLMGIFILKSIRDDNGQIVDFEIVHVNSKAEEALKRNSLAGKSLLKEFPGKTHSGLFDRYVEVAETGKPWEDEIFYNYEGYEYWTAVKAIKLEDGCLVTYSDITEQNKAQLQLAYHKELLQVTLDSSPNYIQVFKAVRDDNGKITDFICILQNKASIEALGEVKGKHILKTNPGVKESGIFDRIVRVTETGVPEQAELNYQYEQFNNWFFQSVTKLGDGVATTVADITEKKKRELELLQLKEDLKNKAIDRYNALFNSIDQGFCTIKVKFDKENKPLDYQFLEVSPSFEYHTGIKNGKGRWMREIADSQDKFWFQKYGSVALTRKSERFDYFSTPLKRWWSVYAFPIDEPELRHVGVLFYDITARKKEEEEKEKLFQKIAREKAVLTATLEALPLAVWIADTEGKIIQSNKQTESLWGKEGSNASGIEDYERFKGFWPGTGKQLKPEEWAMARALTKGETVIEEEIEIRRFDGKKSYILNNAAPIRDKSGRIIGGVTVEQDITERKEIEQKIKAAEARNAFLLKLSDTLHYIEDPIQVQFKTAQMLGEHMGANRVGYAEDTGDEKTVYVTKSYNNGVPEMEGIYKYDDYGASLLEELQQGRTVIHEDIEGNPTLTSKEKEEHRLLQLGANVIKPILKMGKLTALFFVNYKEKHKWTADEIELINETAERTWAAVEWARAEEALAKSEEKYRTRLENEVEKRTSELLENKHFTQLITDSMPDILFVYDIQKWKIIYVNKGITAILGYSPEEVYGSVRKDFEAMLHPDDLKRRINEMARMVNLKPREVRESEFRIKNREGKTHWLSVRDLFFKAGKDGKTTHVLSICQDVTEKIKVIDAYRKERNRSKELKRMNEVMDTFVFAAAHDLKAPVSNLKMLNEVIENTQDEEKQLLLQKKYPEIVKTLDLTISGLVKVLAVEKDFVAGTKRVHFQKVFAKVSKELYDEIQRTEPEIHTDFSECKSIVYIETYVFSIFRNMLSNAMKFRASDKKLKINIRSGCEKKYVWLSFSDNGTGIDLKQFGGDMFKPFKRFSSNSQGSGLGLHLVKSIVTKNGGDIKVESKKSEGTTFKIFMVPYNEE